MELVQLSAGKPAIVVLLLLASWSSAEAAPDVSTSQELEDSEVADAAQQPRAERLGLEHQFTILTIRIGALPATTFDAENYFAGDENYRRVLAETTHRLDVRIRRAPLPPTERQRLLGLIDSINTDLSLERMMALDYLAKTSAAVGARNRAGEIILDVLANPPADPARLGAIQANIDVARQTYDDALGSYRAANNAQVRSQQNIREIRRSLGDSPQ